MNAIEVFKGYVRVADRRIWSVFGAAVAVSVWLFGLLWSAVLAVSVYLWLRLPAKELCNSEEDYDLSDNEGGSFTEGKRRPFKRNYRFNGRGPVPVTQSPNTLQQGASLASSTNHSLRKTLRPQGNGTMTGFDSMQRHTMTSVSGLVAPNDCTFPLQESNLKYPSKGDWMPSMFSPQPLLSGVKHRLQFSHLGYTPSQDPFSPNYISSHSTRRDWGYAGSKNTAHHREQHYQPAVNTASFLQSPPLEKQFSLLNSPSVKIASPSLPGSFTAERNASAIPAKLQADDQSTDAIMKAIRNSCKRKRFTIGSEDASEGETSINESTTGKRRRVVFNDFDSSLDDLFPKTITGSLRKKRQSQLANKRKLVSKDVQTDSTLEDSQTLDYDKDDTVEKHSKRQAFGLSQRDTDELAAPTEPEESYDEEIAFQVTRIERSAIPDEKSSTSGSTTTRKADLQKVVRSVSALSKTISKQKDVTKSKEIAETASRVKKQVRKLFPESFPSQLKDGCQERRRKVPLYYTSTIDMETIEHSIDEYGSKGLPSDVCASDREAAFARVSSLLEESAPKDPQTSDAFVKPTGFPTTGQVFTSANGSVMSSSGNTLPSLSVSSSTLLHNIIATSAGSSLPFQAQLTSIASQQNASSSLPSSTTMFAGLSSFAPSTSSTRPTPDPSAATSIASQPVSSFAVSQPTSSSSSIQPPPYSVTSSSLNTLPSVKLSERFSFGALKSTSDLATTSVTSGLAFAHKGTTPSLSTSLSSTISAPQSSASPAPFSFDASVTKSVSTGFSLPSSTSTSSFAVTSTTTGSLNLFGASSQSTSIKPSQSLSSMAPPSGFPQATNLFGSAPNPAASSSGQKPGAATLGGFSFNLPSTTASTSSTDPNKTTASSLFNFNAVATTTASLFGAASSSSAAASSKPNVTFNFGGNTSQPGSIGPATNTAPMFNFGNASAAPSTTSATTFGAIPNQSSTNMFGSVTQSNTNMFNSPSAQKSTPMFGSGTSGFQATTAASTNLFGSTNQVTSNTFASASTQNAANMFGSNPGQQQLSFGQSSSFPTFGGAQNQSTTAQSKSTFAFGQAAPSVPSFGSSGFANNGTSGGLQFGQTAKPTSTGGFDFAAAAGGTFASPAPTINFTNAAGPGVPMFGGTPQQAATPGAGFSIGSGSATGNRPIARPRRRYKR